MILSLSEDCPIFRPAAELHLHRLMYTIAVQGWHLVALPDPARLEGVLPPHIWRLYGPYLRQSYKEIVNSPQVIARHADCAECDPAKMATFYALPIAVIVEDIESDASWLKYIASKLRPRLARRLAGANAAFEFQHAGGIGHIPSELRRLGERYRAARPAAGLPLRLVAISDSDSTYPGNIPPPAREVTRVASAEGAMAHVLHKRAIENYIPDESLHQYASKRPDYRGAVAHITSLKRAARDHYPMKPGLTEADLAVSQVRDLYESSPLLGLGLGNFIIDFISNFASYTDPRQLMQRDGVGELTALLDMLEGNL